MVLPLSVIRSANKHSIMVELKNGETYSGMLIGVDGFMNLVLNNVICTSKDGQRFFRMSECYLRGNNIKYIRMNDDIIGTVKDEMIQRDTVRSSMRSRGRSERGCRGKGKWTR
ncbi:LSM domain-containing protein [Cryptosporidium serpentis]